MEVDVNSPSLERYLNKHDIKYCPILLGVDGEPRDLLNQSEEFDQHEFAIVICNDEELIDYKQSNLKYNHVAIDTRQIAILRVDKKKTDKTACQIIRMTKRYPCFQSCLDETINLFVKLDTMPNDSNSLTRFNGIELLCGAGLCT